MVLGLDTSPGSHTEESKLKAVATTGGGRGVSNVPEHSRNNIPLPLQAATSLWLSLSGVVDFVCFGFGLVCYIKEF